MVDLLIVGAGPSGLFMAAEASRYGLTCMLIEKSPLPTDKSKALAIQPRTLEIFGHLGIAEQCIKEGVKIINFTPRALDRELANLSFETLDSPYPFILSLEQSKTEAILTEYLSSFGKPVVREKELISFSQNEEGVESTLLDCKSGKKEKIKSTWLIGCDGPHSTVRSGLKFAFEGSEFPAIFSLADVQIEWKFPYPQGMAFLDPQGILAAFPLKGENRYRLIFQSHFSQTTT